MEKPKSELLSTDLFDDDGGRLYYKASEMDSYITELKASLSEMVDFAVWYKDNIQTDYYFIESKLDRARALIGEE